MPDAGHSSQNRLPDNYPDPRILEATTSKPIRQPLVTVCFGRGASYMDAETAAYKVARLARRHIAFDVRFVSLDEIKATRQLGKPNSAFHFLIEGLRQCQIAELNAEPPRQSSDDASEVFNTLKFPDRWDELAVFLRGASSIHDGVEMELCSIFHRLVAVLAQLRTE